MSNSEKGDGRKVGYKRPPVHSRFKPGQSGNPRGRKPKLCSADGILVELLDKKIPVKVAGKNLRLTRREALVTRIVEGALQGDRQMIDVIFKIDRAQKRPERFVLSKGDDAELKQVLHAFGRKGSLDGP